MWRQQFSIPQQFMVGDIKIDTKAQLYRTYMRLLVDAFVPSQEAMLAYLDELIAKHDRERTSGQRPEASTPLPTLAASRPKVACVPGPE